MPGRRCLWGTLWTGLRRTEPGTRENWEKAGSGFIPDMDASPPPERAQAVTAPPCDPRTGRTVVRNHPEGGGLADTNSVHAGPCARMRPHAVEECGFRGHSAGLRYGSLTTKAHESGPSPLSWKRQGHGRGGLDLCASSSRSPPAPWSRNASRLRWTAAGPRGGSETV